MSFYPDEDCWLYVDTEPPHQCAKCGNNIIGPGRLSVKMPGSDDVKHYCDCITEDEIFDIALQFDWAIRPEGKIDA